MFARLIIAAAVVALAVPPAAGAAVPSGHSAWLWGTPKPQGNTLFALEMHGNTGYAVGEFGTVLRTVDGGSSWEAIRTGSILADFSRVDMIDADSLVFGTDCFTVASDDAGRQFRFPRIGCQRRRVAESFPTESVGYLRFEDGAVWKTTDGGRTFTSGLMPVPGGSVSDSSAAHGFVFLTEETGLALSGRDIYRTTDGARTWTQEFHAASKVIATPTGVPLHALSVRGTTVVAVGDFGTFFVSNDGGDTWTEPDRMQGPLSLNPPDFVDVRCASKDVCLMITRSGQLARTADGGRSLAFVEAAGRAVDFASPTRAIVVGSDGATAISDDAGATFTPVAARVATGGAVTRLRATSGRVVYGVAGPWIMRTLDSGYSWTPLGVPSTTVLRDVSFVGTNIGYALDVDGTLFRTENGGATWGVLESHSEAPPNAVFAASASRVLLVGPRGILQSSDGGESFAPDPHELVQGRTLTDIDLADTAIVAHGPRLIGVSSDGAQTWRRIVRPTRSDVADTDFLTARAGYVLQSDGRLYFTPDGGRRWIESLGLGRNDAMEVAFASQSQGWLALRTTPTTVLRTGNSGRTWHPQVLTGGAVTALASAPDSAGFAASWTGGLPRILFVQGSGDLGVPTALRLSANRRLITKSTRVRLTGRITPDGVAAFFPLSRMRSEFAVYQRAVKGVNWVRVPPESMRFVQDGGFTITRRVERSTVFVAQWGGDGFAGPDGSPAVVIRRTR